MLLLNLQGHMHRVKLSLPHVHVDHFYKSELVLAGVSNISTFTSLKFIRTLLKLMFAHFISVKVMKKPAIH